MPRKASSDSSRWELLARRLGEGLLPREETAKSTGNRGRRDRTQKTAASVHSTRLASERNVAAALFDGRHAS